MNSFNTDRVVRYVKALTDNTQCVSCGQLRGLRVRYPCGHSVCDSCVLTAESCLLCLSPLDVSKHVTDGPLSLRVEHASNLLDTFQELYKVDVYRRLRVSEELKVEKQLFPKCIQAPLKYSNSKRISNISNKENIKPTILPGENTSRPHSAKMENKMKYVQQWLNKNETILSEANYDLPRKPFTDINVNGKNIRPKTTNKVTKKKKNLSRNKSRLQTFDVTDNSKLYSTRLTKDVKTKIVKKFGNCKQIKCENNESGIVMDDEILIINDSVSVDKDRAAWLAVIEAENNIPKGVTVTKSCISDSEKLVNANNVDKLIQNQNSRKVPFYKKSSLFKDHPYNVSTNENNLLNSSKSNNVVITIETNSFVTTVKLSEDESSRTKYSIGVQTDKDDCNENSGNNSEIFELQFPEEVNTNINENPHLIPLKIGKKTDERIIHNKDIAVVKVDQNPTCQLVNKHRGLIIDESDSDSEILPTERNSSLEVTAEVHRSETENVCNVLSELQHNEYEHRMRHTVRGNTPASTDSSDKENFDPNRAKRRKLDKKCFNKKY